MHPSHRHAIAITLQSQEKRAGALLRPFKFILGEDRHIGLIVVHCNTTFCKAKNAAPQ
jgi:hypothetical protein